MYRRISTVSYDTPLKEPRIKHRKLNKQQKHTPTKCELCNERPAKTKLSCGCGILCCTFCAEHNYKQHPCALKFLTCGLCKSLAKASEIVTVAKCCNLRVCETCTPDWYLAESCLSCGCGKQYISKIASASQLINSESQEVHKGANESSLDIYKTLTETLILELPPVPMAAVMPVTYTFEMLKNQIWNVPVRCTVQGCMSQFIDGAPRDFRLPVLLPPEHAATEPFDPAVFTECILCTLIRQTALSASLCIDGGCTIVDEFHEGLCFWCVSFCRKTINMTALNNISAPVQFKGFLGTVCVPHHYNYTEMLNKLSYVSGRVCCDGLKIPTYL
ncbi:ORF25-like protein [Bufonid herpesvirus 1]|uniref:ORF25-like protein n=1 Tax=Bufonid herpesvirus 1 TaxID=2282206 RepID=UPI000EB70522|nr:ORF25-like protein [Bufonid herpesvirus 1]AXF48631.1 ORF25-like protein [Bufonid herpesvirus 1]